MSVLNFIEIWLKYLTVNLRCMNNKWTDTQCSPYKHTADLAKYA